MDKQDHVSTSSPRHQQIGVSRPPLAVEDLPTPEEAFRVRHIGFEQWVALILGPSLIVLGASVGGGEWLSGPLSVAKYGFLGIGWVILVSTILQVFYNVELARFTLATGETPVVAFGRIPPGYFLWVPLALLFVYLAFILGEWTMQAGGSLFTLVNNRPYEAQEVEIVRILGIALMLSVFLFVSVGRKIMRTLEGVMGVLLAFVLIGILLITLVVVPLNYWGSSLASLFIPTLPPSGADLSVLGSLAGYTALAAGLNFMFIGYYRDKGYGMGTRMGFLGGLLGRRPTSLDAVGKIFPESEKNTRTWKRWFRILVVDQWVIYFIGALVGMVVPSILVAYLAQTPGNAQPTSASMIAYAATNLGSQYGPVVSGWMSIVGFMVLYSTLVVILEVLVRNMTDALFAYSRRVREWCRNDTRRFYFPFMLVVILLIGILIHLPLSGNLTEISANMANLAAIFFPLGMIYLNRHLPRPARITWWSYLVLILNVLFFGFFFVNFVVVQLTGAPLVRF